MAFEPQHRCCCPIHIIATRGSGRSRNGGKLPFLFQAAASFSCGNLILSSTARPGMNPVHVSAAASLHEPSPRTPPSSLVARWLFFASHCSYLCPCRLFIIREILRASFMVTKLHQKTRDTTTWYTVMMPWMTPSLCIKTVLIEC